MNNPIDILENNNPRRRIIMALPQNIYEVITVPLQDGTTVELKPASIKLLKAGQKELQKLGEIKESDAADATLDVLLDVCVTLLKKQRPELIDREVAEELFDLETIYKVIEVMLGVKLNDPKLLEAAMRISAENEKNQTA
jgi:hypothetical protein